MNTLSPQKRRGPLSAVVFAYALLVGLGCSPAAKPTLPVTAPSAADPVAPMISPHTKEEPIAPKPRPPIIEKPTAPAVPPHALAKEWYSPRESDFRPAYDRDAANQAKESWNEYWSWVQTFYAGAFFSPGWTAQGTTTLRGVQPEKMRDELRADLNELGRRIAAEWSKDNGVRKIDTASLRVYGGRIANATRLDDGSGQMIQKEIEAIRAEVNAKLAD